MQNAKDSFYVALRTRLMVVNANRTILLRSAVRPGILVEEAEAPFAQLPADVFVLRWQGVMVEQNAPSVTVASEVEIHYSTMGTQSFGGLDRGRNLSAMDGELRTILAPYLTPKLNYAMSPALAMLTNVFWEEPVFGVVTALRDRLTRVARIMVYSYQEPGE